jgi:hypothetical protein
MVKKKGFVYLKVSLKTEIFIYYLLFSSAIMMKIKSLDEIAQEYQKKVGKPDFVNTYAATGPIIIKDRSSHILWTDKKTPGYPNLGIVGKLVFKGGNWRDINDASPLGVYTREVFEEIKDSPVTPAGTDAHVHALIFDSLNVVSDYFSAIPARILQNNHFSDPVYCYISSVFRSEIEMQALCDVLAVSSKGELLRNLERTLQSLSAESDVKLTPFDEIVKGENIPFGFGDDYKIADILEDVYGIKNINTKNFIQDVFVCRLPTSPNLPFSYRRNELEKYLRKDNNPYLCKQVTDKKVFEKRE